LKKKKVSFGYEAIKLNYILEGTYTPDFYLPELNRIIEYKGHFRVEDKRKMAAVKKANPDLDLRFVFYKHDIRNEKWCKKRNIPYAVGKIPDEWLL
jgi:hypothetical protein